MARSGEHEGLFFAASPEVGGIEKKRVPYDRFSRIPATSPLIDPDRPDLGVLQESYHICCPDIRDDTHGGIRSSAGVTHRMGDSKIVVEITRLQ